MPLGLFKRTIDQLGPYLFRLELFNWGEPLLNTHFVDMVRYAKQSNIWVSTSTSLSLELTDRQIEDLVLSGLDKLIISLDGVTEEKYLEYRIGGDFELVMHNMRAIVRKRTQLGLYRPFVVWQYLVFRHNEEDIENARLMAQELGVALCLMPPFVRQDEPWKHMTPTLDEFNLYGGHGGEGAKRVVAPILDTKPQRCDWLYASAAVNANGSLSPCCAIWEEKDDFGHLQGGDLTRVRNNDMYQSARALFTHKGGGDIDVVCKHCPVEGQQTMLSAQLDEIRKTLDPRSRSDRILRRIVTALY